MKEISIDELQAGDTIKIITDTNEQYEGVYKGMARMHKQGEDDEPYKGFPMLVFYKKEHKSKEWDGLTGLDSSMITKIILLDRIE